ncbi:hypothetical protein LT85_0725 [Collimonas arenae]|uniref:Uncharacterized protein n=1 Tax=Collimonas arenae TaxID=279058 RepID=A0A0A1F7W7_9BURK|nr:hypothetical protein LT85_0725 [Collimonas arenae]
MSVREKSRLLPSPNAVPVAAEVGVKNIFGIFINPENGS